MRNASRGLESVGGGAELVGSILGGGLVGLAFCFLTFFSFVLVFFVRGMCGLLGCCDGCGVVEWVRLRRVCR